jgi:hypothetical protein
VEDVGSPASSVDDLMLRIIQALLRKPVAIAPIDTKPDRQLVQRQATPK